MEVWRSIVGYEGIYSISNYGSLRSDERVIIATNHEKRVPSKVRPCHVKRGYCVTALTLNYAIKHCFIHRLVAQAFTPNPENKPCVNHIDNNP